MAILKALPKSNSGSNLSWALGDQPAVSGSYPGTIVDILEAEGIEKEWQGQTKVVDITRFLIAYRDDDDQLCLAQTNEMTISNFPKSNLIKFLTALKGEMPSMDGSYDFLSELGTKCMVTIEKKTSSKGTTYGLASSVAPVAKRMAKECPERDEIEVPGGLNHPGLEVEDDAEDSPF